MELKTLTSSDKKLFNDFVAAHPSGSFLQSWDWGDWQEQVGHKVSRHAVTENGAPVLAAQVLHMKLPGVSHYYLYIPYGPLVSGDEGDLQKTLNFFLYALIRDNPQALFIRVEQKQNFSLANDVYILKPTPHIQPGKSLILDVTKTHDELLAGMHPKTRYNIKVAMRHGVVVEPTFVATPGHGLHLKEALDLIIDTARRQKYRGYDRAYYEKLITFFALQKHRDLKLSVYKALWQGQLLAAGIMLDFGHTRTYLFGGSSQEHRNIMAPYLLHWQAIRDAAAQQQNFYDFWGAATSTGKSSGFVRFKEGFGGSLAEYPPSKDIIIQPLWYTIYKVIRSLLRFIR